MKGTNANRIGLVTDGAEPVEERVPGNSEARLELAGLLGISYKCNYEASRHAHQYYKI